MTEETMKSPAWVKSLVFLLLTAGISAGVYAQTTTTVQTGAFDTTGFPLWVKDLRRAEIVTFGSFPFTFFFVSTVMDTYRSANHGWDTRYAPWPFKSAGAIDLSEDEQIRVIGAAAVGSVLVALIDFAIVQYKRDKAARVEAALPEGSPIIIRRPWPGEQGDESSPPPVPNPPEAPAGPGLP